MGLGPHDDRSTQKADEWGRGEVTANLYSLVYSCKALGLDPEAYLADVLTAVATTPSSQVASLTPWAWAEQHPEAAVQAAYATS